MAPAVWADEPWPLIETPSRTRDVNSHPSIYIANEMAHAHNAMIRGLNAIYNQAPHLSSHSSTDDISDFLFLVQSWTNWLSHHHALEENLMFPAFEAIITNEPGFLNVNIEQHHSFEAGLEKLKDFATETEPGGYKGEVLRGIIESFAEGLCRHLHEEIECLMGMKTEMEGKGNGGDDGEALLRAYKVAEKEAGKQDKTIIPPLVLGLRDRTFLKTGNDDHNWPAMAWFAPYIVHYLLGRKHAGAWRFLPCDAWGRPRPLRALALKGLEGGRVGGKDEEEGREKDSG